VGRAEPGSAPVRRGAARPHARVGRRDGHRARWPRHRGRRRRVGRGAAHRWCPPRRCRRVASAELARG